MVPDDTTDDDRQLRKKASPRLYGANMRAVVESHEDRPDECTIYPLTEDTDEFTTQWITALEESFVDALEQR